MLKKIIKISIFIILFSILTIGIYIYYKNDNKVAVLGYHGVLPNKINTSNDNLIIDMEKFEKELKLLKKLGYDSMTLDEFYCWKNGDCKKKHKSVLITFDDGYQNNYDYAFKLLKKYNMNAVVFCVGSYTMSDNGVSMNLETIKNSYKEYPNIEFASHSYDLHYEGDKDYDTVDKDAKQMLKIIDSQYFAYPYGVNNKDYIKALKDNNYKMAFTFGPGEEHRKADLLDNNYTIPRLNISKDMSLFKFFVRMVLPI